MDNQERRRGHFHRGRRGPDRRGQERRTPQAQEPGGRERERGDHVDVEQIMRDIRARIAQRHGIDLSTQQIQELAARRLEAILDPRAVKPALLDQLKKSAAAPAAQPAAPADAPYTFEEGAVYESHRGIVRLLRKLFKPLLMLFFNPAPVERALAAQAKFNTEAAQREAEHRREQAEWNALHYELLQRLVTDAARASIELQAMSARVESLAAKVDFNERRVRHMEGNLHQARPSGRPVAVESVSAPQAAAAAVEPSAAGEAGNEPVPGAPTGEPSRRRRRRRRGRRGGGVPGEASSQAPGAAGIAAPDQNALPDDDADEGDESDAPDEMPQAQESVPVVHAHGQSPEPVVAPEPEPQPEPDPVIAPLPIEKPEPDHSE